MGKNKHFEVKAGLEWLSCCIQGDPSNTPEVLFIHGAGKATKERYYYLADTMEQLGKSSLFFDFSGHGNSTGIATSSSLQKKYIEALNVTKLLNDKKPVTLVASSMGGYIAIKLAGVLNVDNLVLFCPAAYSINAFEKKFDNGFTEEIRKKDSWKQSDSFQEISLFKGNLLIITGEEDKVIPTELIPMLYNAASNVKSKKLVVIPSAPHGIHYWLSDHPEYMKMVKENIRSLFI